MAERTLLIHVRMMRFWCDDSLLVPSRQSQRYSAITRYTTPRWARFVRLDVLASFPTKIRHNHIDFTTLRRLHASLARTCLHSSTHLPADHVLQP